MGLKDRIVQTTVGNLMTALSFGGGAWLMTQAMPWLTSHGLLPVHLVMK
jgi:hypothetical protein